MHDDDDEDDMSHLSMEEQVRALVAQAQVNNRFNNNKIEPLGVFIRVRRFFLFFLFSSPDLIEFQFVGHLVSLV